MSFLMQKSVLKRLLICFAVLPVIAFTIGICAAWWLASRPANPITPDVLMERRERAMQWLRTNEERVLADGNSALWWMIQDAGRRSGDTYLQTLTQKALLRYFSGESEKEPWRRMLEPAAPINAFTRSTRDLFDYQRFFHHALTCIPMSTKDGDTAQFLTQNMCSPMLTKVVLGDPVCTTHQLFGVMLIRQTGCAGVPELGILENELLRDVQFQLTLDPLVRDPHIQRLLMLALHDRVSDIKPIWLHRMLDVQESDGGWLGQSRVPEFPSWLQPWRWREVMVKLKTGVDPPRQTNFDFHATAQAILLLTILTEPR